MDKPAGSRARVKLSVSGTTSEPVIGLLDREFSGVELMSCPLHFEELNQVIKALPAFIREFQILPYDVSGRTGELKGVILGSNLKRDSAYLRFIVRSRDSEASLRKIASRLRKTFSFLKVVSMNIQPVPHQILEGPEEEIFDQPEMIEEDFSGRSTSGPSIYFHPQSFFQATPEVAGELYKSAARLGAGGFGKALDLFCGVGGFSLFIASELEEVTGVELSAEAIACARASAERNNISNCEFVSEDVNDYLQSRGLDGFGLVVVNPPRRGVSESILKRVLESDVKRLIYSSCNFETLLRDIKILEAGFELVSIQPFDMFPLTEHLEVMAVLDRRNR